jgi:hypothetical protein
MDSNDPNPGDQEQLIRATNETGPQTVQRSSIEVGSDDVEAASAGAARFITTIEVKSDDEEAAPAGAAVGFSNKSGDGAHPRAHPFKRDPRYRLRYADNIPSRDLVFRQGNTNGI